MKTLFLETSFINHCLDKFISGKKLSNIIHEQRFIPIISIHVTYELARTFLNEKTINKGVKLFNIIKELNPIFSCSTESLLRKDVNRLLCDEPVVYMIDGNSLAKLNEVIENLTHSRVLCEYKKFIQKREKAIVNKYGIWDTLIENIDSKSKIKSFDEFVNSYINTDNLEGIKRNVYYYTNINLSDNDVYRFVQNINCYPALRARIRAILYLNFITIKNKNRPGKDKTDDLRHLIDSSYCSTIVSRDKQLLKIANYINPDIEVLHFDELIA